MLRLLGEEILVMGFPSVFTRLNVGEELRMY